jgi:hypothetical protein
MQNNIISKENNNTANQKNIRVPAKLKKYPQD